MKATVPISASTARSTLRPKKELQLKNSSSRPEPSRPITAPAPTTPTQTPTAWALSSGGNDVVMIDSVVGITSAAPTPIAARSPISVVGSFATSAAAAAPPKTTSPTMRMTLRPKRSPIAPAISSRPAKTIVYASTIHWSSLCVAPVSRARSGSATFRPLTAETTIIRARATTPSTTLRRRAERVLGWSFMGSFA